jgi:hypothetical protein
MSVNFTITYFEGAQDDASLTKISNVVTPNGEDITRRFLAFCEARGLPLSVELEIESAARQYAQENP